MFEDFRFDVTAISRQKSNHVPLFHELVICLMKRQLEGTL
jgi:hypothetical protein